MSDNVDYLPRWKKDSTPEEFLLELSHIARKHPERFKKILIFYEEEMDGGRSITRFHSKDANLLECLGLTVSGKHQILTQATD